jgi:sugar (pentulose or hexulose) kinase
MKNHAQAMCDERGIEITNLIISGCGSNGDLFMQIFADVFGVRAQRNNVNGSASLGAAICTALALGLYRIRQEAIDNMVCRKDTFTPQKENVSLYKEINESVYKEIVPRTDELLKQSYQIFSK